MPFRYHVDGVLGNFHYQVFIVDEHIARVLEAMQQDAEGLGVAGQTNAVD